jgi:hypothetical protein
VADQGGLTKETAVVIDCLSAAVSRFETGHSALVIFLANKDIPDYA